MNRGGRSLARVASSHTEKKIVQRWPPTVAWMCGLNATSRATREGLRNTYGLCEKPIVSELAIIFFLGAINPRDLAKKTFVPPLNHFIHVKRGKGNTKTPTHPHANSDQ